MVGTHNYIRIISYIMLETDKQKIFITTHYLITHPMLIRTDPK